jgi:hypothetical protein
MVQVIDHPQHIIMRWRPKGLGTLHNYAERLRPMTDKTVIARLLIKIGGRIDGGTGARTIRS